MAEDTDEDSKTEDPTSKRLSDAREKGQVATSREVGTAFLFVGATTLFYFKGGDLWLSIQAKMRFFFSGYLSRDLTSQGIVMLLRELLSGFLLDLAPFFLVFVILGVAGSVVQHGFVISFHPLTPNFSKINPLEGFKRLFSSRSLIELIKSVLKMFVVSIAVYWATKGSALRILGLAETSIANVVDSLAADAMRVMVTVTIAFVAMALLDFIYQLYEHTKGLKMTKQEVKDELKQMEGDPLVKSRIRQIQREMAQRRMMAEVPKADVVITNPTHYAVALFYKQGEMRAPKLIGKGQGRIAERIREVAREHNIPIVQNPPLAQTLFRDVPLDQIIPQDLFKAVAQVLAYVYSLRRNR